MRLRGPFEGRPPLLRGVAGSLMVSASRFSPGKTLTLRVLGVSRTHLASSAGGLVIGHWSLVSRGDTRHGARAGQLVRDEGAVTIDKGAP